MSTIFQVMFDIYRLIQTFWNACLVLLQVIQSVMNEAQQEAIELMKTLDGSDSVMEAMTMTLDGGAVSPWQMLIISRASSFVLLLRLSKSRVLHLEVDEAFIMAKLKVIKTELLLNIQHVPRMLSPSIGTHDTRVVKYMPTTVPYVWEERSEVPRFEEVEYVGATTTATSAVVAASPVREGGERGTRRKKYVQLLVEGALRRRLRMDRQMHTGGGIEGRPGSKKAVDVVKTVETAVPRRRALADTTNIPSANNLVASQSETVVKTVERAVSRRRALADATNIPSANLVASKSEADCEDTSSWECSSSQAEPKQLRVERHMHAALSENLSIANMVQAASMRKALDTVNQPRRMVVPRRKHELYSRGLTRSFSLVNNVGRDRVDG